MYDPRTKQIEEILTSLHHIKVNPVYHSKLYAIEENIKFFESAKSFFKYFKWLFTHASKLDPTRLLEVNDLLPEYDEEVHTRLIKVEKKTFPGLITPLVNRLIRFVKDKKGNLIIADLGSGGMEVERQLIKRLTLLNHSYRIIFVGIDNSSIAHEVAKKNLNDMVGQVGIVLTNVVDEDFITAIWKRTPTQYTAVICKNDIFQLDQQFPPHFFNLVFHTLFQHHLSCERKLGLDIIVKKISKHILEYDGYKSWFYRLPQTLEAWDSPVFLNASIFSILRYPTKSALRQKSIGSCKVQFFRVGTYLLEYKY